MLSLAVFTEEERKKKGKKKEKQNKTKRKPNKKKQSRLSKLRRISQLVAAFLHGSVSVPASKPLP